MPRSTSCFRAAGYGTARRQLLAAAFWLAVCPGPAVARDWVEVSSPHFVVASDAGEARARLVATEFEQIRGLFGRLTDVRLEPQRPLLVLAVRGEDGLRRLLPGYWERKGRSRPAGIYVSTPDRDYIVVRTDLRSSSYSTINHEYVHRLTGMSYVEFPPWLVEGLACFFETVVVEDATLAVGRISNERLQYVRSRKLLPLEKLLKADRRSPEYADKDRVHLFYAQAAVLTHYLLLGPGAKGDALGSVTRILKEGLMGDPAASGVLGDLRELDKALRAYIDGNVFRARLLPVQTVEAPPAVRSIPAGEVAALRGSLLAIQGRPEAREALDEALRLEPLLAFTHESLGKLSLGRGRPEEAARHLTRAVQLDPQSAFAYYWLAVAAPRASDAREAALRRAIELAPYFGPAQRGLAELLMKRGRLDEAESFAWRAIELEPRSAYRRLTLAGILRQAGRAADALLVEQEVRGRAAHDLLVLSELMGYYTEAKRLTEAEALVAEALAGDPGDADVLDLQAGLLFRGKRFDEAETVYRRALKIRPHSSDLMNSLGYMNADRNVRVDEALALIDRALVDAPLSWGYLDSRGWALYRLGRLPEAEAELRRALDQRETPEILEHLGDVCVARGAAREGLAMWRRASERDDIDDEAREQLRRKIRAAEEAEATPEQAPQP